MPTIVGRTGCHWCGFEHAHVKRGDGKRAYVHCPQCGLLTQARSGHQEELLLKGMSEPGQAPAPVATPTPAPAAPVATPAAPPRRHGLWDQLMSARP